MARSNNTKHGLGTAKSSLKQRTLLESFTTTRPSATVEKLEMTMDRASANCNNCEFQQVEHIPRSKSDVLQKSSILSDQDVPVVHFSAHDLDNSRRSPSVLVVENISGFNPEITKNDLPTIPHFGHTDGSTKDQAIIINSSPIKSRTPLRLTRSTSLRLVSRQKAAVSSRVASSFAAGNDPSSTKSDSSLPFALHFPLHIKGPQTLFPSPPFILSRSSSRMTSKDTNQTCGYRFLRLCQTEHRFPKQVRFAPIDTDSPTTVPEEVKASHPVIARLVNPKTLERPLSHRPWTDKWRPSCATEVLGNESRAVHLRDWLRALELQLDDKCISPVLVQSSQNGRETKCKVKTVTKGTKRSRVVRAVDKTRRKKSRRDSDVEDDWIVYSDDDQEDFDVVREHLDEFGEVIANDLATTVTHSTNPNPSGGMSAPAKGHILELGQLYNTILLVGPSGCGKTASVYACAEELGWDVFEVFPGIGRRNASNIDNLIGEVGKNHLVLKNRSGDSLKTLFGTKQKSSADETKIRALSQISPRKSGNINVNETEASHWTKSVRQSLILLEEVDILFKEDTNFWSTVIKIIEECKRPVICTCNDISLVPVQNLPLQSILFFEPCISNVATYYLRALCAAEGYKVDWNDIARVYSDPLGGGGGGGMIPARAPTSDLRATINALQLYSSGVSHGEQGEDAGCKDAVSLAIMPRLSVRQVDFFSMLDAHIEQDVASRYAVLVDLCNHVPSEDDEIGHVVLSEEQDGACWELYDQQTEIMSTANEFAKRVFTMKESTSSWGGEEDRRSIRQELRAVAGELCPVGVNEASVSMEYIPYAKQILVAEDQLEEEMRPRSGRKTRNSGQSEYVRMLDVTVACRELISTALAWV